VSSAASSRWPISVVRREEQEALTTHDHDGTLKQLSDESVMQSVQLGDSSALGILFDRYYRLIYWVGLRILRNSDEAQDLVQEVFLYLHQRPTLFDPSKGQFRPWIVQVAYSRAFNRAEYLRVREFVDYRDIQELVKSFKSTLQFDAQDTTCLRLTFLDAFKELTDLQRTTLQMFFFQGLTLREISEKLNETLANTRHYYYRGLDKLRSALEKNVEVTTASSE
jgi:RNA polymerase sigma-70 factor, ECF subfamily